MRMMLIKQHEKAKKQMLDNAIKTVDEAISWLSQFDCYKILIKQTRNLGDTLHITPIARHYKTLYPDCKIAFIVGNTYLNAHQYNDDFDHILTISANLDPQARIKIGNYMMEKKDQVNLMVCPSIFPFGEVWPTHTWSHPVISHQYFSNAYINYQNILGGGKLRVVTTEDDKQFANNFMTGDKYIALEYVSYSHHVPWSVHQFNELVSLLNEIGYKCISIAGPNEGMIKGTVDARGATWRRTVEIIRKCKYFIGIGSGITMLASTTNTKIIEIGVSDSISMKNCGYSDSVTFNNHMPRQVFDYIKDDK